MHGTAFGGTVMSWIDSCASLSASRGGRCAVVAAGFDEIAFVAPLRLGEHAVIESKVTRSWGTSLEVNMRAHLAATCLMLRHGFQVMVSVLAEDPLSSARRVACTALVTYVSADRRQLPFTMPGATACSVAAAFFYNRPHHVQRPTKSAPSGWMRVCAGGSVSRAARATTYCLRWIRCTRTPYGRHRNKFVDRITIGDGKRG
jgi:acyl-CoA hydrolase